MTDRIPGIVLPTIEERVELAGKLAPHDADRRAALLNTLLLDVAINGRDAAMVHPATDRHLSPRQLAARSRGWNETES